MARIDSKSPKSRTVGGARFSSPDGGLVNVRLNTLRYLETKSEQKENLSDFVDSSRKLLLRNISIYDKH